MKIKVMAFVDNENNDFFKDCRDENGFYDRDLMIDQMNENEAYNDISENDFDEWMNDTFEDFDIGYDYFHFYQSASDTLYNLDRDAYYELKDKYVNDEMYSFVEEIITYCDENEIEIHPCFGNGDTYYGTIEEIEIEIDDNKDEEYGNYEVKEISDVKIEPPVFQLKISDIM